MAGLWKGARKAVGGLAKMAGGGGGGKRSKDAGGAKADADAAQQMAGPDADEELEMNEFGGGSTEGEGSDGSLMTFKGHSGAVYAVALSPSDQKMASGGIDETLRIWTWDYEEDPVESGAPVGTPAVGPTVRTMAHTGIVLSCDFSPTGRHIATAAATGHVNLYGAKTANLAHALEAHSKKCYMVKFTPAGSTCPGDYVASCSLDRMVRLWDVETGQHQGTLKGHNDNVFSIDFSTNGRLLASAGDDKFVALWDWRAGKRAHVLMGHYKTVWSTAWNASDQSLVTTGMGYELMVWDMRKMQLRWRNDTAHGKMPVHRAVFSPDEKAIVTAGRDRKIAIWDAHSAEVRHTLSGHGGSVYNLCFHPAGDRFLSTSLDGTVKLWSYPPKPVIENPTSSVTLETPVDSPTS